MEIKTYIVEALVRIMNFKNQLIIRIKGRVLNWFRFKFEFLDDRDNTMSENLNISISKEATKDNKGD